MASPQDVLRYNQQGIADAIAGLGEVFLGNPQLDAQLARGQAQMALRDKRMTEAEIVEQEARRKSMLGDRAERVFHQLAATDPNSPRFQEDHARNLALMGSTGQFDPEELGELGRLFTNVRGGDIDQVARSETDLSSLIDLEGLRDERAQRQRAADIFGPKVSAAMGGDMPDFMKRAAAIHGVQDVPFDQAIMHATNQFENVSTPTGEVYRVSPFSDRAEALVSPAADAARRFSGEDTAASAFGGQPSAPVTSPSVTPGVSPEEQQYVAGLSPEGQQAFMQAVQPDGQGQGTADGFQETLFDAAQKATGIVPSLQNLSTSTLGQFTDLGAFPEVAQARARLIGLNARLRPIFTVSNRPSRWELESVEPALVNPTAFKSPAQLMANLNTLREILGEEKQFIQDMLVQTGLPTVVRNEAEKDLARINRELQTIGTPPQDFSAGQVFQDQMGRFEGRNAGDIFEDASRNIQGAPAESGVPDYSDMSDEELRQRLQGGG